MAWFCRLQFSVRSLEHVAGGRVNKTLEGSCRHLVVCKSERASTSCSSVLCVEMVFIISSTKKTIFLLPLATWFVPAKIMSAWSSGRVELGMKLIPVNSYGTISKLLFM